MLNHGGRRINLPREAVAAEPGAVPASLSKAAFLQAKFLSRTS
jgi:hypothetical protein